MENEKLKSEITTLNKTIRIDFKENEQLIENITELKTDNAVKDQQIKSLNE